MVFMMTNTNTPAGAVNRSTMFELTEAARDAIRGPRGTYATVKVTLPDGTTGHAQATHVLGSKGAQDVKVANGLGGWEWWFVSQLTLAA
jgi:N-methylhydantoinase B/oxoprolinase/acetone carboxylase alpha subunit